MQLRPYQQECLDAIPDSGAYLIHMATGLGKTVVFTHLRRRGRMLILSHREELVHQPLKYFDCTTGIEMAGQSATPWDEVVSASVQSLTRRLQRYDPNSFDVVVCDEAHHAAAQSYKRIFEYFSPRLLLGFTATPNRADNVRLDDVFDKIIFSRDLRWGIANGYLSDIYCRRVDIGYDLSEVRTHGGDYMLEELQEAMDGTADAVAEAYTKMATGATLIFAVSVRQVQEITARIPGAVAVTGTTKDRADIIAAFTRREIPCLVNCMVFTEGTDIPLVETVIIARPTQSDSLYAQMVGRGLRLCEGKERLNLIDCVGVTGKRSMCTAPSLLGIDLRNVPSSRQKDVEGLLFDLPSKIQISANTPESWIRNIQVVDLWAQAQKYNTHGVNWIRMPDQSMVCMLKEGKKFIIPPADELGTVMVWGGKISMQSALDRVYQRLCNDFAGERYIWDLEQAKRWGKAPASEAQIRCIQRRLKGFDTSELTKLEASQILNRLMLGGGKAS